MINLDVVQGELTKSDADTLIVNLFEGVTEPGGATAAVDLALDGALRELVATGDFKGKTGEVTVLYPRGALNAQRVLVVGLGKQEAFNLESVRRAMGAAVKRARSLNAKKIATVVFGAGAGNLPEQDAAQATFEGALLALYRYQAPRQQQEEVNEVEAFSVFEMDEGKLPAIQQGLRAAQAVAAGVYLARDLVNYPPNVATPTRLAQAAEEIAEAYGMQLTVGDRQWAEERNMGAFLAVAKGAGEPPKFIVLEHNAGRDDLDTVALVGKGITFDTGGISIKPTERMGLMKSDMGGAAAVLGAMKTVGMLDLPLHVIGIAPATENMPDANAYRPADVVTASNGKTIEIITTDAEGRMILADGLVYAGQFDPDAVIDLATLTGSCVIALGQNMAAGLFTRQEDLRKRLEASSERTGERVWPMPLWEEYREAIRSDVADIKNSGGRRGGVATSAIFLKEFTDYPWAHLDIAGMALTDKESPYTPAGATGYGVRLLVDFLRHWVEKS